MDAEGRADGALDWLLLEMEIWDALWEGGPRKREGGGSRRFLDLDLGERVDIFMTLLGNPYVVSFVGCV